MTNSQKDVSPLIKKGVIPGPTALTGLVVAACAFGFLVLLTSIFVIDLNVWQRTAIFAVTSMILCIPFKLPGWWIAIYAILPVLYLLQAGQDFPVWIYPLLAGGLLVLNWNSFGDRVPLYLSNKKTVDALSQIIEESKIEGTFYDLGCGIGSALIPLGKIYKDKAFIGVETAPLTWFFAFMWLKLSGCNNVKIIRKSIWDTSIQDAGIVYAFLSPHPMNKLLLKCKKELPQGASLISNSFDSDKFPAKDMIPVDDRRKTKLLVWDF